ncbi:XkdX family protein [Brochothrix thermosphacta]|nr:XkdX family protein [Brochothrix thermosphacta]SPN76593.1 putative XkdX family protein [Brochothrix thermosphacta]
MMPFLTSMYKQKRIDNEYLKKVVKNGHITADQYKEITGEEYLEV